MTTEHAKVLRMLSGLRRGHVELVGRGGGAVLGGGLERLTGLGLGALHDDRLATLAGELQDRNDLSFIAHVDEHGGGHFL